jgi:hypothetical protein
MSIEPEHIERLEHTLVNLQGVLRKLVEEDRLAELIPIWKRPGWTTPAEFFLVHELLNAVDGQVRNLEKSIHTVIEGASMVGQNSKT